ncbi:MAG TPA: mechanosensitive ion channel domain-containing protein, partial [Polyangiaceae bacterium]
PDWLTKTEIAGNALWQWIALVVLGFLSYVVARVLSWVFVTIGKYFAKRTKTKIDEKLIVEARPPLRILFFVGVFRTGVDSLALTVIFQNVLDFVTFTLLVIGMSMLFLRVLGVLMGVAVSHLPTDTQHELRRRELRTRFSLLQRIANVIVIVLAGGIILTQFAFVRTVGLSVLASAGIAGVVVGLAAQKSMSSVIAGIQISLTQPIRIGDTVKVEGQVGVVEELSLTNVVIRLADKRRLIVPISRFLDQPFENWTRSSADLIGTVTLVVDFTTPIEDVRAEAKRLVEAHPLWDKRLSKMTVGDVTQGGVLLNVYLSAGDSSKLDDLKNDVREALLKWLQGKEGGAYFIVQRTQPTTVPAPTPKS